jgi:hypothetical protein
MITRMKYLSLALLATVAACAPTVQELAGRCAAMGFAPGSEALASCVERQALASETRRAMAMRQLGDQLEAEGAARRLGTFGHPCTAFGGDVACAR